MSLIDRSVWMVQSKSLCQNDGDLRFLRFTEHGLDVCDDGRNALIPKRRSSRTGEYRKSSIPETIMLGYPNGDMIRRLWLEVMALKGYVPVDPAADPNARRWSHERVVKWISAAAKSEDPAGCRDRSVSDFCAA